MLRLVELYNTALGGKDLRSEEKKAQSYKEMIAQEGLKDGGDSNNN
jgi:hypothetical protein